MSDEIVRNFDSNQFSLSLGSVEVNAGRGAGTFFEVEPLAEDWTTARGADGEVTRSKVNNGGATVTFTVMRSSQAHKDLHALRSLDLASPNGAGVAAFQGRDRSLGLRYEAAKAWIRKPPKEGVGRESGEVTWELELGKYSVTDETAGA